MTAKDAVNLAIRAGAIVALVALGLAIALIAWQERLVGATLNAGGDPAALVAIGSNLRIAVVLLLISAASVVLVVVLVARLIGG